MLPGLITMDQLSQWIRFGIQICLVPFCIYVVTTLESVKKDIAIYNERLSFQIAQNSDQEQRIRLLEQYLRIAKENH